MGPKKLLYPLALILLFFILFPFIGIISKIDIPVLADTIKEKEVITSVFLTLRASMWATLSALIGGIPLGYILARKNFPFKKIVEGLIDLPVIIPHTAAGIALLSVWGRNSFPARLTGLNIMGSEVAVSIAMFFVSVPFLVNSVKTGFSMVDPRYEKTAVSLGATPWQAFRTISLPMIKKSVFSGSIMMWGRGISEFGAVVIIAYHPMTAPVLIYERFTNFGLKYALPVTVIMIAVALIIFVIMKYFEGKR